MWFAWEEPESELRESFEREGAATRDDEEAIVANNGSDGREEEEQGGRWRRSARYITQFAIPQRLGSGKHHMTHSSQSHTVLPEPRRTAKPLLCYYDYRTDCYAR